MSRKLYNAEDFVLDQDFQNWVLNPNTANKLFWKRFLAENPEKRIAMRQARLMVLNLSRKKPELGQLVDNTWINIDQSIKEITVKEDVDNEELKEVVPMNAMSTLEEPIENQKSRFFQTPSYGWAAVLLIAFSISILANLILKENTDLESIEELKVEIVEHQAPLGVKSVIKLADGSKVLLNSGSMLRYEENFGFTDERILELEGEAYFEVERDSLRPFIVKSYHLSTRALGTSFNISAYPGEAIKVSLVSGKVKVSDETNTSREEILAPGETVVSNASRDSWRKQTFDLERVLAWTRRTIHFENTPITEVIRILENWYGVKITVYNLEKGKQEMSGKFTNQSLKDVLEGLSYSARFDYIIDKKEVSMNFK